MWTHVFSLKLVLNVWDYRILPRSFLRELELSKQHARIKAIMQVCALEHNSVRWIQWGQIHVWMWYTANETVHLCMCVEQAEGFWKDSAWRKCPWCAEEGDRHSFLSLLCKLSKGKPVFLSLLWSMPSDQTVCTKLHGFFPGEPHAITPFQAN